MKTILRTIAFAISLSQLFVITACNNKSTSNEAVLAHPSENPQPVAASDPVPMPTPIPPPTPTGPAARAAIGYQGGSLKSPDGRIQISLPPGALYADTEISIQPVNLDDLDGIGPTYQLSPEGTQFNTPVTLVWQLSDADLAGHAITDATIATRDESGGWKAQRGVQYDADHKIVRVTTNHFSPWKATWISYLPNLTITPSQSDVSINKSLSLAASDNLQMSSDDLTPPASLNNGHGDHDGDLLAPPPSKDNDLLTPPAPKNGAGKNSTNTTSDPPKFTLCVWRVNGQQGGNSTYGYIRPGDHDQATFMAPAKVPARNPVAVSCEQSVNRAKIIATSNITITDKQGWNVEARYDYVEHHSTTGPTGAGTIATNEGSAERVAYSNFHVYSDSRYAAGAVGGMGKGTIIIVEKSKYTVSTCRVNDATHISGEATAEGNGDASKSGRLTVNIHGENMHGHQDHERTCGKGDRPRQDWDTAGFGTTCNFTGVDYEKGGTFEADVPSDQGHGKCKLTISPM